MSAYTPGPWIWDDNPNSYDRLYSPPREMVLWFGGDGTEGGCDSDHDRQLIAAAPTLVECLTMGATMQTPEFLEWLADRLVTVYGEDPGVDFVLSLRDRAGQMRAARLLALGEQ